VKDIDDLFKFYRVEGPIGVSIEILDDLENAWPFPIAPLGTIEIAVRGRQ
jgi:hypothetical protein